MLRQKPRPAGLGQVVSNPSDQATSIYSAFSELISVRAFVGPGEKVVEPPQIDPAVVGSTEKFVSIKVSTDGSYLLVTEQERLNPCLFSGRQVLIHPTSTYKLGKLLFSDFIFQESLHSSHLVDRVITLQHVLDDCSQLVLA